MRRQRQSKTATVVGAMVIVGLAAPAAAWVATKPMREAVPARMHLVVV